MDSVEEFRERVAIFLYGRIAKAHEQINWAKTISARRQRQAAIGAYEEALDFVKRTECGQQRTNRGGA